MTLKQELHRLVDDLSEDHAAFMLEELLAIRGIDQASIPDWQKNELSRRKVNLLANPDSSVDWETVKSEIRSRLVG